jgi:4-hydroxy-3-methylbut-2-enyl diphosphate reductase
MAVETVERALARFGGPIYVFHEIVHNRHVVEEFSRRGVSFVQSIDEVPSGGRLIFSAHGVSPTIREKAAARGLQVVIDATCPLVDKVHREVRRFAAQGYWIVLVGHRGHDEIVGTSGEAADRIRIVSTVGEAEQVEVPDPEKVAVMTQTTLSVDDTREIVDVLRRRFPRIVTPPKDDICYATQNRQDAVKKLAREVQLVLIIGSANSENSMQLCKVARAAGVPAYLVNSHHEIDAKWLEGVRFLGISSGASAPERLVDEAVEFFRAQGAEIGHLGSVEEKIHFALPSGLQ